jgi:alkylation response protein AidB-like acyl-CoA dehydrogenase
MKELGLFGVTIPEEYGGMGLDLTTYAMIVEELSRGWISISGIVNTHFIGSYLLMKFGTEEQKQHYLPKMATGEIRAAFSLSEPELGSDVAAIKTAAKKSDDGTYEINGTKMWVTNGLRSGVVFVLARTDPSAEPKHRGLTCFIADKEPGAAENTGDYAGLNVPPQIKKMGYKGVESTELVFDGYKRSPDDILGGEEAGLNKGFPQMMDALELGRVNVAARGVGLAQRALELALKYAQERRAFGKPIAEHQAIAFQLAEMATKVEAAHLMMVNAARLKDSGERNDVAAGMAKYLASEFCSEVTQQSFRIHGGYGYSKEYEIERLMRDAPFLLIGEGTSEIQKSIISKRLLAEYQV